ncbi:uncharacterized protein LOC117298347 [Asterias rubens]|uniref:uncharacterized protein LOC117298347 n=1 Tax=Asterias rubens TaxID=7604 RepID=UPI000FECC7C8|nr:uncharacterized protein LOC117298347 [Asterias rubens]
MKSFTVLICFAVAAFILMENSGVKAAAPDCSNVDTADCPAFNPDDFVCADGTTYINLCSVCKVVADGKEVSDVRDGAC